MGTWEVPLAVKRDVVGRRGIDFSYVVLRSSP